MKNEGFRTLSNAVNRHFNQESQAGHQACEDVRRKKCLYLLVNPKGSKLWRWKYCVDGKEKLTALGSYPDVSLAQAREKREQARKLLAIGVNPMAQKKADNIAHKLSHEHSFSTVARAWWLHWMPARSEPHRILWRHQHLRERCHE